MPSNVTLSVPAGVDPAAAIRDALSTDAGDDRDVAGVRGSIVDNELRLRAVGPSSVGRVALLGRRRTFVGNLRGLGPVAVVVGRMRRSFLDVTLTVILGFVAWIGLNGGIHDSSGALEISGVVRAIIALVVLGALVLGEYLGTVLALADRRTIEAFLQEAVDRGGLATSELQAPV